MSYGGQELFSGVSLQFNPSCRYGVVGANGAGKSTLLRILAGEENPSEGSITAPNGMRIGVLEQEQLRHADEIILEIVLQGNKKLWEALKRKNKLLSADKFCVTEANILSRIEEELEAENAYGAESEAAAILDGLGIPVEIQQNPLKTLSGGYRLRVLLARLLFSRPDILLLDEPTNHLDIYTIRWFEQYLLRLSSTVIVVSHDQEFLETVCTHIADIDYGTIKLYKGNYSRFLQARESESELREKEAEQQQKKIADLQRFVDRFKAKASKATQAQSRVKQLEKIEEIEILKTSRRAPHVRFNICRPSGIEPLKVHGICKSYGKNQVLKEVSFAVERGEKIAIIGPNGIGKSTLLRIIAGLIPADKGRVEWGYETWPAVFPQDFAAEFKANDSAFEWLSKVDPSATIGAVRSILGSLLFSGEEADKKTSVLSGGECSRLLIGRIIMSKQNFLLLDEPTNHLDLETVTELKRALSEYSGTLLLVSHNRYLVSGVADRIIEIRPEGINDFRGSYPEFLERFSEADHLAHAVGRKKQGSPVSGDGGRQQRESAKKLREEQKEQQRRLRQLEKNVQEQEEKIETLEQKKQVNLQILLDHEGFMKLSGDEQRKLFHDNEKIEKSLDAAMRHWEELQSELETAIATNNCNK
jgi:ATPase subunit of ABC transporter with duplicated ATPase domains